MNVIKVALSKINISDRIRAVDEDKAVELSESLKSIGLINPITVEPAKDGNYSLIAGAHRVRAAQLLGWSGIHALILDAIDKLKREKLEIMENLARNELSVLERGDMLARLKKIYELENPDTKAGVAGAIASNKVQGNANAPRAFALTFTQNIENETGISQRTAQEEIKISESIPEPIKAKLVKTDVANEKKNLLDLAKQPDDIKDKIANGLINSGKDYKEVKRIIAKEEKGVVGNTGTKGTKATKEGKEKALECARLEMDYWAKTIEKITEYDGRYDIHLDRLKVIVAALG